MSKARKTAASSGEPDFWRVARDWLHHWLPKVRGSSPKTVEAYRIGLRILRPMARNHGRHAAQPHRFRAFRPGAPGPVGRMDAGTERGYSDRTIMLRMTTMRVFLDHAGLEHPALTALGNDAAGIRVKPPARKPVDHLGEEHTKALLTAWGTGDAKSRRNRMLLILMYDTAARIGELAALTIADVGMDKPARAHAHRQTRQEPGRAPGRKDTNPPGRLPRGIPSRTVHARRRQAVVPLDEERRHPAALRGPDRTRSSKPRRPEHAAGRARPCPNASTAT